METNPLVSIILNNYNYDRFLTQSINSALDQTYSNIEVIVVDDGSTDSSRDIIARYGQRITSILQPNGKQGAAFNSGFARSKGEIVLFLDSDDYLFPNSIENVVAVWKPTLAKVHFRLSVVDIIGEPLGYSFPQGSVPLSTGKVWQQLLEEGGYVSTPTTGNALNRNAMAKIFPIPDKYKTTADDYLSTLIPFYGEVVAIEERLGAYRIHDSNQWALATMRGARFRRFVMHDLQNFTLLTQTAQEFGYKIPPDLEQRSIGRLWSRIISLRLDPLNHPVPSDQPVQLAFWGIQCLWKYTKFSWPKCLIYSVWFLWVGFMPLLFAEPAIAWLYVPQHRPKLISWTVSKIHALLS